MMNVTITMTIGSVTTLEMRAGRTNARAATVHRPRALIARATALPSVHLAMLDTTKMAPNARLVKQANTRLSFGSQATHAPRTNAGAATEWVPRASIARSTMPTSARRAAPGTT